MKHSYLMPGVQRFLSCSHNQTLFPMFCVCRLVWVWHCNVLKQGTYELLLVLCSRWSTRSSCSSIPTMSTHSPTGALPHRSVIRAIWCMQPVDPLPYDRPFPSRHSAQFDCTCAASSTSLLLFWQPSNGGREPSLHSTPKVSSGGPLDSHLMALLFFSLPLFIHHTCATFLIVFIGKLELCNNNSSFRSPAALRFSLFSNHLMKREVNTVLSDYRL